MGSVLTLHTVYTLTGLLSVFGLHCGEWFALLKPCLTPSIPSPLERFLHYFFRWVQLAKEFNWYVADNSKVSVMTEEGSAESSLRFQLLCVASTNWLQQRGSVAGQYVLCSAEGGGTIGSRQPLGSHFPNLPCLLNQPLLPQTPFLKPGFLLWFTSHQSLSVAFLSVFKLAFCIFSTL